MLDIILGGLIVLVGTVVGLMTVIGAVAFGIDVAKYYMEDRNG